MAVRNGVVTANDHVVIISRSQTEEFLIKVVTVDDTGSGIKNIRPKSLLDMLKAAGQALPEEDASPLARPGAGRALSARPSLARASVLVGSGPDPLVVKPSELQGNGVANGNGH